jgi:hypothetical protein
MSVQRPSPGSAARPPKTRTEALAEAIAERLDERQRARAGWVTAAVVAEHLSVDVDWVYEHADELGGIRLGDGPKARRRFRLATVDERLEATASCPRGRTLGGAATAGAEPRRRRRRSADNGHSAPLLPVRGERSA